MRPLLVDTSADVKAGAGCRLVRSCTSSGAHIAPQSADVADAIEI
jgi:hypothetical protein